MIVIIGAGDHALEIYDVLNDISKLSGKKEDAFFFDEDPARFGQKHGDSTIIDLYNLRKKAKGVLGIGIPHRELIARCDSKISEWLTVIHPTAQLGGYVTLGKGNILKQQVLQMPYSQTDDFVQINVRAIIGHHVQIGAHTCIGPAAKLMGRVQIGQECYIGAGSIILEKLHIADRVTIGAGAVVIKNIDEPGSTWAGNPARKLR
jgi:sugar O-acyltransferase (sialic acid O-acetyltransferase NeuD family)